MADTIDDEIHAAGMNLVKQTKRLWDLSSQPEPDTQGVSAEGRVFKSSLASLHEKLGQQLAMRRESVALQRAEATPTQHTQEFGSIAELTGLHERVVGAGHGIIELCVRKVKQQETPGEAKRTLAEFSELLRGIIKAQADKEQVRTKVKVALKHTKDIRDGTGNFIDAAIGLTGACFLIIHLAELRTASMPDGDAKTTLLSAAEDVRERVTRLVNNGKISAQDPTNDAKKEAKFEAAKEFAFSLSTVLATTQPEKPDMSNRTASPARSGTPTREVDGVGSPGPARPLDSPQASPAGNAPAIRVNKRASEEMAGIDSALAELEGGGNKRVSNAPGKPDRALKPQLPATAKKPSHSDLLKTPPNSDPAATSAATTTTPGPAIKEKPATAPKPGSRTNALNTPPNNSPGAGRANSATLPTPAPAPAPAPAKPVPKGCYGYALFHYESEHDTDLQFPIGALIENMATTRDDQWLEGEYEGMRGIFPVNWVEIEESSRSLMKADDSAKQAEAAAAAAAAAAAQKQREEQARRDLAKFMSDAQAESAQEDAKMAKQAAEEAEVVGRALYDFDGRAADELSFKEGDVIRNVLTSDTEDWFTGDFGKKVGGMFPASHVEIISAAEYMASLTDIDSSPAPALGKSPAKAQPAKIPAPAPAPAAEPGAIVKALYDFSAGGPDEVSFREGDILKDVFVADETEEWFMGTTTDGRTGLFPSAYVEIMPDQVGRASYLGGKTSSMGGGAGAKGAGAAVGGGAGARASANTSGGQGKTAKALYDFETSDADELELIEGMIITNVLPTDSDDWLSGEANGRRGIFPAKFVEIKQPKAQPANKAAGDGPVPFYLARLAS